MLLRALIFLSSVFLHSLSWAEGQLVDLHIREGVTRNAKFYPATSGRAVLLVPQFGLSAESWRVVATQLQKKGVSALALDSNLYEDVIASANYLKDRGYLRVTAIGASIGGAAVIQAARSGKAPTLRRIIVLGMGPSLPIDDPGLEKIFVVAKRDTAASASYSCFHKSSEPKTLLEYPGYWHGQKLFESPHGQDLMHRIVEIVLR